MQDTCRDGDPHSVPAVDGPISVAQCNQLRGLLIRCPHLHRKQSSRYAHPQIHWSVGSLAASTPHLTLPHPMRMRAADWQWLAEWKEWKDCLCLSLNEVLVLDVLQEMDPGVLLQRSGKVLVREEKRTSFSCFVFRKFYSVFSLCKSCWDEILDSFFTQDVSFSKGTSVQTRFF